MRSTPKSRNYCFTLNNYDAASHDAIKAFADTPQCKYITVGEEKGEEGTPHLQGYVELSGARTLAWCKRAISARAHFELRRGTSEEAATYCQKDGNFWEKGTRSSPRGASGRADLDSIRQLIDEGKSQLYIAENYFSQWVQYRRSFAAYEQLRMAKRRNWKTFVNVIWGGTGLGKTRFVYQQHKDDDIWVYPGKGWFDGYCGQPVVLFDDYRGDLDISTMLQVCDRYPMDVPIKGGHVNWCPRRIYITSNVMPQLWYDNLDAESRSALFRRFNRIDAINEAIF